ATPLASDRLILTGAGNNLTVATSGGQFNLSSVGTLAAGTYTLVDYGGSIQGTGGFAALTRTPTTIGSFNAALNNDTTNGVVQLILTHTAVGKIWNAGTGNWDIGTNNWQGPSSYADVNQVTFDDSTTGGTTPTVTASVAVAPQWMT